MAREIMTVFCQVRAEYAPVQRGGRKWPHYVPAARLCLELKQTPLQFVMQRIPLLIASGLWYPQLLESRTISADLAALADKKRIHDVDSYAAQWTAFQDVLKVLEPRLIIADDARDFTPLFRCVLAVRYGLPAVIPRYADDARKELAGRPVAAELFREELSILWP